MTADLLVTVCNKAFGRVGILGDPISVEVSLRHNLQPTATVEIASDHRLIPALLAPGSRIVIDFDGSQVFSGPVQVRSGSGEIGGTVTVTAHDDWRLLSRVLGWPNPTGSIATQGAATSYDLKTGPAETVVKWFATRAITRLGLPVTVAPDLGRGASVTVAMRMHPLADRLLPVIDAAGVGVTVRQVGAGLRLDCYAPVVSPRPLTPSSGEVVAWSWEQAAPTVTRTVVGGQGEGTAREFRARTSTATEAEWGDVCERFVDARDTSDVAELDARGDLAITEGAMTSGLSLELSETDTFKYGRSVRVGDLVTAQLIPGAPPVVDVLREATLKWTLADGFTASPIVGDRSSDPNRTLARTIAALATGLRNIGART